jgi:hypothetical protein
MGHMLLSLGGENIGKGEIDGFVGHHGSSAMNKYGVCRDHYAAAERPVEKRA